MDIKAILESSGIHTRIVPCELEVSYSMLKHSDEELLKREFITLSQNRYGSITQWLNKNKSKNRTEETDEVLLELLIELYKKLEHIEQLLQNKAANLLTLESSVVANFIGHSIICVPEPCFTKDEDYYIRIFLPIFPQRHIGIFAKAIDEKILSFTQISHNDTSDFDSFVVQMERATILDKHLERK